ncbi:hypothetical protein BHM03_00036741, partial [Ensete ventricosum]
MTPLDRVRNLVQYQHIDQLSVWYIPSCSPVLGYLTAGILIGPYGLSIIRHVHGTKAIAEFGVLQERGESTSRHGRATFSVLLFQVGFQAIAEALGLAAVKAIVAIAAIIAGGRLFLRPIYKQIAENQNAEIFSANTLLVILGTSLLTAR